MITPTFLILAILPLVLGRPAAEPVPAVQGLGVPSHQVTHSSLASPGIAPLVPWHPPSIDPLHLHIEPFFPTDTNNFILEVFERRCDKGSTSFRKRALPGYVSARDDPDCPGEPDMVNALVHRMCDKGITSFRVRSLPRDSDDDDDPACPGEPTVEPTVGFAGTSQLQQRCDKGSTSFRVRSLPAEMLVRDDSDPDCPGEPDEVILPASGARRAM